MIIGPDFTRDKLTFDMSGEEMNFKLCMVHLNCNFLKVAISPSFYRVKLLQKCMVHV